MKRKIVQHGSSSLTITLPRKWVETYKLEKGDELEVETAGPVVTISTEQGIASPKKEINAADFGMFTKSNISHLYQLGYDEIEIRFDDHKIIDEIKERLPDCIGYEIMDQKEGRVYIKSIATTLDAEFDALLRKAFMITNEMAKAMLEALEKGDYGKLKELRNMEQLNNRFTDVCLRILNKKGYKVPKRTMQMYEIVKNIERIADEFKYICDLLSSGSQKQRLDKILVKDFEEAMEYYLMFYNMFYKFDPELRKKLYLGRTELTQKYSAAMEKATGKQSVLLHHLINIVEKTYEGAGGYFALVL
jgi:phosphate uptake regulator